MFSGTGLGQQPAASQQDGESGRKNKTQDLIHFSSSETGRLHKKGCAVYDFEK